MAQTAAMIKYQSETNCTNSEIKHRSIFNLIAVNKNKKHSEDVNRYLLL